MNKDDYINIGLLLILISGILYANFAFDPYASGYVLI